MGERKRIYVIDSISEDAMAQLAARHDVVRFDDPARHDWPDHAHVIINRTTPVTADQIARAKHLELIAKHGIGVDHIDLGAAKAHGVTVINTPGTNARSVAELTVMMAVAVARKIPQAEAALRAGAPGDTAQWRGFEISGRRAGIIGLGNVGSQTAAILRHGYGCVVSAHDPYLKVERFAELGVERAETLEALLRSSDLVCLHVPLTDETHHMINANTLAWIPRGSILINTARGGVMDEAAVADALTSGHLFGAATDVFESEPPITNHPLLSCPNFIATPHIGAATKDSARRSGEVTVNIVLKHLG